MHNRKKCYIDVCYTVQSKEPDDMVLVNRTNEIIVLHGYREFLKEGHVYVLFGDSERFGLVEFDDNTRYFSRFKPSKKDLTDEKPITKKIVNIDNYVGVDLHHPAFNYLRAQTKYTLKLFAELCNNAGDTFNSVIAMDSLVKHTSIGLKSHFWISDEYKRDHFTAEFNRAINKIFEMRKNYWSDDD